MIAANGATHVPYYIPFHSGGKEMATSARTNPTTANAEEKPEIDWEKITPEIAADLATLSDGWRPEIGDVIRGRVLSVKLAQSPDRVERTPTGSTIIPGSRYPLLIVLRDGARVGDKAVAVHCFHSIPKNEVLSARPARGDRIYIRYLGVREGEQKDPNREPPKLYSIDFPDNVTNDNVWDAFNTL